MGENEIKPHRIERLERSLTKLEEHLESLERLDRENAPGPTSVELDSATGALLLSPLDTVVREVSSALGKRPEESSQRISRQLVRILLEEGSPGRKLRNAMAHSRIESATRDSIYFRDNGRVIELPVEAALNAIRLTHLVLASLHELELEQLGA